MNTKGQDRLRRHELFVEDGCGGLWTTDTGSPIVIRGKDKLAEHAVWSLKCFPDWEWYNIKVFETDDPNHFWVECDGHGKILFPGYPEGYYENHFLHSFELDDGKIKRNREFMNVFQQLRVGVLAASTQGDADAKSLQTGAWVAGNATQHNYLSHWQEEKKRQEVDGCKDK